MEVSNLDVIPTKEMLPDAVTDPCKTTETTFKNCLHD